MSSCCNIVPYAVIALANVPRRPLRSRPLRNRDRQHDGHMVCPGGLTPIPIATLPSCSTTTTTTGGGEYKTVAIDVKSTKDNRQAVMQLMLRKTMRIMYV